MECWMARWDAVAAGSLADNSELSGRGPKSTGVHITHSASFHHITLHLDTLHNSNITPVLHQIPGYRILRYRASDDAGMSALMVEEVPGLLPFERKRINMPLLWGGLVHIQPGVGQVRANRMGYQPNEHYSPTNKVGSCVCQGAHWSSRIVLILLA